MKIILMFNFPIEKMCIRDSRCSVLQELQNKYNLTQAFFPSQEDRIFGTIREWLANENLSVRWQEKRDVYKRQDDLSTDNTVEVVEEYINKGHDRIVLIKLEENSGVGGAIAEGYKWCRDHQIQATAVMAGDAQMDPDDLPALLDPIVNGEVDYTKGNRLFTGEAWRKIPKTRYMGNAALSLMTKIASGYWHVADSQTGYTLSLIHI